MSVTSREVLAPNRGQELPAAVRRRLIDLGVAANHAALALASAALSEVHALANLDSEQARQPSDGYVTKAAITLWQCALGYQEQLIKVYAAVAAKYAVYASRVAADVSAGRPVSDTDVSDELPSRVVTDLGRRLPAVAFPEHLSSLTVVDEQHTAIAAARSHLTGIVEQHLFGDAAYDYDCVDTPPRPQGSTDLVADFPVALHDYAATVTWAVGVFSSSRQAAAS